MTTTTQVCQAHGDPDDLVLCPYRRCQVGRVPQWTGFGMPAGTRECNHCEGKGKVRRADRDDIALRMPLDDQSLRPCICYALRRA